MYARKPIASILQQVFLGFIAFFTESKPILSLYMFGAMYFVVISDVISVVAAV
jgi:hypothetical protein